jgi:signal transduction histidine kinase/CheY-like chemotaxis protein
MYEAITVCRGREHHTRLRVLDPGTDAQPFDIRDTPPTAGLAPLGTSKGRARQRSALELRGRPTTTVGRVARCAAARGERSLNQESRTSPLDLTLEALRRDHPDEYRRWLLVGIVVSLIGYGASCVWLASHNGFAWLVHVTDPYLVVADLVALAMFARGYTRAAGLVPLAGVLVDLHYSLLTLSWPLLGSAGLIAPALIFATGLFFGGRAAFRASAGLMVSAPLTVWLGSFTGVGPGMNVPGIGHFLLAFEAVILAVTAMLAAFLRSFAQVLHQSQQSERRARDLQMRLQHTQKLEALGLLAGGVAHDFNNLLTAVGGYGALLATSSDGRAREFGGEIVAMQRRGASLVRQLLAFARKDLSQPTPMDLARTLHGTAGLLERLVGEQIRIDVQAQPGCAIVADPGRIEQVFVNLASNARDAMPEGGTLTLRCTASEHDVTLEVADTGRGMDESVKARVFEPFFTTKDRHQGMGLGLSTVHGIVTESRGSIEVDSKLGRGTRFIVRWPRSPLVIEAESAPPEHSALEGLNRRIVLIEDHDGARNYVKLLLEERGFDVAVARDGEAALHLAEHTYAPALVLSDVLLPQMTGPELIVRLRARWPEVPCLFMSGFLGDIALGAGFDPRKDLVAKPFTASELLERIASKL